MTTIQTLINEVNAKWEAKKASVINATFKMKGFNGESFSIKVLSVNEKGFCQCVEVGNEEKGQITVSINWVLSGKKI